MYRKAFLAFFLIVSLAFPSAAQEDGLPDIGPSAEAQQLYDFLMRMNLKDSGSLDLLNTLYDLMNMLGLGTQAPAGVQTLAVDAGGVPCLWIVPDQEADPDRVVLYHHGGGYVTGSPEGYTPMLGHLALASGVRVLATDYRLAPAHPFPAALEDAAAAYRWLLAEGYAPEQIAIAGDSAGGGLTVAALVSLRDAGDPLPAAAVLLSAWTDLAGTGATIITLAEADAFLTWENGLKTHAQEYAGSEAVTHPLISPLYADLGGLPPVLIMAGSHEILLSDSTRLARRMRAAGVDVTLEVWDGMVHVWPLFTGAMPEAQQALEEMSVFIQRRFNSR